MSKTALATFSLIGKLKGKPDLVAHVAGIFGLDEKSLRARYGNRSMNGIVNVLDDEQMRAKYGNGPAPVINAHELPDFKDIYYHPEGHDRAEKERATETARRRTMAMQNRQKYGLHGVEGVEPVLRFEPEDFVLTVRGQKKPDAPPNIAAPNAPKIEPEGREVSGTRYVVSERDLATKPRKMR